MKKSSILILIIICLVGCKKGSNETTITGEIKGLGTDTLYLYGMDELYDRIDTIYVENDKFSYTTSVDTITSAYLLLKNRIEYPVFLDKGNKIKIKGDTINLNFLTISGNIYNEEFTDFQKALEDPADPSEKAGEETVDKRITVEKANTAEEMAAEFILQHHSSYVSLYLLDKYFVQKETPDFSKIKKLVEVMTGVLQDKPYIERLNETITQAEKSEIGKYAPFFSLPNAKGEKITRSSDAFKQKSLLINFWASWNDSISQKQSNSELREIYKKYKKNKYIGMLGISLDVDKQQWKDAIKRDTLDWEQVCDFGGLNSEAAVQGIDATLITIEVNSSRGCMFYLVGLPDSAVKESHQRIISALQVNGYKMPTSNLVVNMAPADIRKEGSAYDLPLAIGLLGASETISSEKLSRYLMMGELSLDGSIQPIKGALPIAIKAREENFEGLIIPQQNAREAAVVNQLKVYGVSNIKEVIQFFNGERELEQTVVNTREEFYQQQTAFDLDFADVKGQENVKRALEVAAAGGHNLIMIGAPGSGKSMMAKRLPSILPPLSLGESLETTKIHSVAGKLNRGSSLISQRPFRDPHHTISQVAMVGGGSFPQPGEISLAHNGVLFLDELPEFNRGVLEVLRQPLEDRQITISRIKSTISYPANLMLIASMNPCPCGYYNHPTKACVCSPGQVQKYLNKISGPLLDRIDIQIEIVPVPFDKISDQRQGEASSVIRNRVIQARRIQEQRYADHPGIYCNAQMSSKLLSIYARPDDKGLSLLRNAMERLNLSARAYDRILKVARTIADLEGAELIQPSHLAEAISYRNLDRENWAG